ncbi:MAG: type II secretion system minor pseudopilin GspJ [Pseudomonadales bacterium]
MAIFRHAGKRSSLNRGGFTLLEVLVAMSIFAVIGLAANKMLRTMIQTHEITSASNQSISSLTRVFSIIERDLSQIVPRRIRDEYGDPLEALVVGYGEYQIEFTRTGWNNPTHRKRSELQRVAYSVEDEKLIRHFWLVLDRAEDSEPITQELMDGVEDFSINLLDQDGQRSDAWPDFDAQSALPVAIEIILNTSQLGKIRRVFSIASTAQAIQHANPGQNSGQGQGQDQDGRSQSRREDPQQGNVRTGRQNRNEK